MHPDFDSIGPVISDGGGGVSVFGLSISKILTPGQHNPTLVHNLRALFWHEHAFRFKDASRRLGGFRTWMQSTGLKVPVLIG